SEERSQIARESRWTGTVSNVKSPPRQAPVYSREHRTDRLEPTVARRDDDPDFIEAIARGLDVIKAFGPDRPSRTLADVAMATGLARPTARRILRTLESLGYVRSAAGTFALTPRVLELGMVY